MKLQLEVVVLAMTWSLCSVTNSCNVAYADSPEISKSNKVAAKRSTDTNSDPMPDGAIARFGSIRFRPSSGVDGLAISTDGSGLISVGKDITGWNAKTGQELWRVNGGRSIRRSGYGIRPIAFSATRQKFYTPYGGNKIAVWNIHIGLEKTLELAVGPDFQDINDDQGRFSIDVTDDASRFALCGPNELIVCDANGNMQFEIKCPPNDPGKDDENDRLAFSGSYTYGRFSPTGELIAVVTSDRPREIRIYNVKQGIELRTIDLLDKVVQLCFSPSGKSIATTERDNAVRMYDVESVERAWSSVVELKNPFETYTSVIEFSPSGNLLAVGATDHRIHLFDPSNGIETGTLVGHDWYPWSFAFSPDGQTLFSSGWEAVIRRWDVATLKQLPLPAGIRGSDLIAASHDGRLIAFVDDERVIHVLDAATREEQKTLTHPTAGWTQITFSPDSKSLAGGGSQGNDVQATIWDLASGQIRRHWEWPKGKDPHSDVEALEYSPDGRCLAAAVFRQSKTYVWDLSGEIEGAQLRHDEAYGLSFAPDSKTLATVGWDKKIRLWSVNPPRQPLVDDDSPPQKPASPLVEKGSSWVALTREIDSPKEINDSRMYAICSSHDLIATAHLDGTVSIWQRENMIVKTKFQVPGRFVFGALRFSPDGQWLATGTMSGEVILWEPWTGQKAYTAGHHENYVYTVGFGCNNRTMISGASDSVGYLWDLAPFVDDQKTSVEELWQQLSQADAEIAYAVMWKLASRGDEAVHFITEKLRPVETVFDLHHDDDSKSPEENSRIKRMKQTLVDKNPKFESELAVRRAISVLIQMESPTAIQLLKEFANAVAEGKIGRYAKAALETLKRD